MSQNKKKSKKKKSRIIIILSALFIALCIFSLFYEPTVNTGVSLSSEEIPNLMIPKGYNDTEIISHQGYILSYSEEAEQAYWVAYLLTRNELYGEAERSDDFKEDPEITTGSAALSDYKGSGYDRGHLCSSADQRESIQAQSDSFYMSNMSPQAPSFNRGIWKRTEETVRNFADTENKIYVVTGPVLNNGPYKTIGTNKVSVPDMYYKAVLKYDGDQSKAIGFLEKNEKLAGDPEDYAVSIDQIEKVTDIDFFPALPDNTEDIIEAEFNINDWDFDTFSVSKGLGPTKDGEEEKTVTADSGILNQIMASLKKFTLSILDLVL